MSKSTIIRLSRYKNAITRFKKLGFVHHSFSREIRQVAKERGIKVSRLTLSKLGFDLRKESRKSKSNESILGRRVLDHILKDMKKGQHKFVVDGLRDYDELYLFRQHEMDNKDTRFVLVGVDAPQELRWQRLRKRGRQGDPETFEDFKKVDDWEMSGRGGQEVGKCMKMADYIIVNDSSVTEMKKKVKEIVSEILG